MNARPLGFMSAMLFSVPLVHAQTSEHQHHVHAEVPADNQSKTPEAANDTEHVAPEPPQHVMGEMSYGAMTTMMQMDDRVRFGRVLVQQLEWRGGEGEYAGAWDAQAWYGGDYNKLWFKTEGESTGGAIEDARAELFWNRIIARWWNLQAGVREDFGEGPSRTWAAVGIQGIAPYWFDVEATAYVGEQGRSAIRVKGEYDLLFTQRLVLQPEGELHIYGKSEPERGIGSGLSTLALGFRLRYEFRREFAPYMGVLWTERFGDTADLARAAGNPASDFQWLAGLRFWF